MKSKNSHTVGTVPKSNGKIVEKKIDTLTHKNDQSWVYGIERHFQQYFSYFVAVSFIGG
jgi:hypothetical protein